MKYFNVHSTTFAHHYANAWQVNSLIRESCTAPCELYKYDSNGQYFLSDDNASGYYVSWDGELCLVFSMASGRGNDLMVAAIESGATNLDCFDGYLPKFYAKHGFVEVKREPNWTAGEPDVVFMSLSSDNVQRMEVSHD